MRPIHLSAALLLGACASMAPGAGTISHRDYTNAIEQTANAVRQVVPRTGLIVAQNGAISNDEWSLGAQAPRLNGQDIRVHVLVQRHGAGSKVSIEQTNIPLEPDRREPNSARRVTTAPNYARRILGELDRVLQR